MHNFCCPQCHCPLAKRTNGLCTFFTCFNLSCNFYKNIHIFSQSVGQVPVLIPFGSKYSLLNSNQVINSTGVLPSRFSTVNWLAQLNICRDFLLGQNIATYKNFSELSSITKKNDRVLIIGGGSLSSGLRRFFSLTSSKSIHIESIDIYPSPHITCIADAHYLPFGDSFFDIVIIQAVLEHVINPHLVVSGIHRVLKEHGTVYSEIPLMQSVHEYPFDFTRYTVMGHKILFDKFKCIRVGFVSGALHSFLFLFTNFISSLLKFRLFGIIVRILLSRLFTFLECLLPSRINEDFACGTFFLGHKEIATPTSIVKEISKF